MKQTKREQLDELLEEASAREIDDLINQYPSLDELEGKYEFSQKHNKAMKRIFKKAERTETNHYDEAWKKFGKFSFRAAAIICMIFTVLTMVAFAVPEIRVMITNYIVEQTDDYISINTQSNNQNEDIIDGAPQYIPEGFEVDEIINNNASLRVFYKNEDGKYIRYQRYSGEAALTIDSDETEFETINIGSYSGYINRKNEVITIIFHDGIYTYKLIASVDEKELRTVAESIVN